MSKFLKKVWYGEKTFRILKDFEFRGDAFVAGNLFTCSREDYIIHKKYLSDDEVIKDVDHSELTREELAKKRAENKVVKKNKKTKKTNKNVMDMTQKEPKKESKSETKRKAVQKNANKK